LEGQIEFSIIKFSELDSIKFRADAEFYQRRHLKLDEKLRKLGCISIKDVGAKLDCSAFYPSITDEYNFDGEGIPFLRVNEIQNGLVKTTSSTAFLPQHVLDKNPSTISTAYPFDIVIAKGGNSLAKLGLLPTDFPKYALSRDLIAVRTSDLKINKYFVWLFLHSAYGQSILWRTASQTGQPHLTLPSIEQLAIPKYSKEFEATAETLYMQSERLKNKSIETYRQAEIVLLETLSMADFSPATPPEGKSPATETVNIKSFKDSFAATGRLDAEYYQPKYEVYQSHVFNSAAGWDSLANICNLKDSNYTPKEASEYAYIELADIDKSGGVTGCTRAIGKELPSRARRKVEAGDVLISSIEGSLTSCAIVPKSLDGALCSTGFYVVDSDKINSETLLVLFKSELMQSLLKQSCSGTILTAINKAEISNLPVPMIDAKAQQKIATLVQQSFTLKAESEHLLAVAKRAVEMAIEQDEDTALDWLLKLAPSKATE
jgi:restriction endonuclease S subunit